MSVIAHAPSNTLVIGEVSHYHFYQPMNQTPRPQKYQPRKTIIPSVPRQHCKAPVNSPLSFIRQQKLPQNSHPAASVSPLSQGVSSDTKQTSPKSATGTAAVAALPSSSSSPSQHQPSFFSHSSTDLLKNLTSSKKHPLAINRRRRKVSFDENVMVICTRFDEDDTSDTDEEDDTNTNIQHQPEGSFLSSSPSYHGRRHSTGEQITNEQRQRKRWNTFVTSVKHFKYTKSPSSPSIV